MTCSCSNNSVIENKKDSDNMKIVIDNKEYDIVLEKNNTTDELLKILPLEIVMKDLNNNEKYAYLNNELPTNEYKPNHINKGDIMLYNNNCLVIFYDSFNTNYSYTKIGHIDNLDNLNDNINVKLYLN